MFQFNSAPDRTKPVAPRHWAIITDEVWDGKAHGMPGRLLAYQPTHEAAIAQQRQWRKDYGARTRVVELNTGDLPFRHYIDPRLHFAAANSQYLH
jgi:hypothetical protein